MFSPRFRHLPDPNIPKKNITFDESNHNTN